MINLKNKRIRKTPFWLVVLASYVGGGLVPLYALTYNTGACEEDLAFVDMSILHQWMVMDVKLYQQRMAARSWITELKR